MKDYKVLTITFDYVLENQLTDKNSIFHFLLQFSVHQGFTSAPSQPDLSEKKDRRVRKKKRHTFIELRKVTLGGTKQATFQFSKTPLDKTSTAITKIITSRSRRGSKSISIQVPLSAALCLPTLHPSQVSKLIFLK